MKDLYRHGHHVVVLSRFSVVVLAAGGSRRMGSNKLLKTLSGKPLVSWSVEAALSSGCAEVVVVVGHEAERVKGALPPGVRPVVNKEWGAGISSSIKRGVQEISQDSEAVVIMVADQPLVHPAIPALLASLVLQGGHPLSCASVKGEPRNPAAFHRSLYNELLGLEGDRGAKSVIFRHLPEAALLEVPEDMLMDVDTLEDLERLTKP
ncbi:Purine catabolism protein PucB [Candidatus Calditenuaceae archaeon HR02]|nr:Purine catabolism protein PucB [Candidatus Calditenuaceae archaeon HR02]